MLPLTYNYYAVCLKLGACSYSRALDVTGMFAYVDVLPDLRGFTSKEYIEVTFHRSIAQLTTSKG